MWKKLVVLVCWAALAVPLAPAVAQAAPISAAATVPHQVSAEAPPSSATLAAVVSDVAYEPVFGPDYATYKALYPTEITWTTDGCSVPVEIAKVKGVGWVLKFYSGVFEKSCERHDFGYRNYGNHAQGLALDSTPARRKSLDVQQHLNMDAQCLARYSHWYSVPARKLCYEAADVFYGAVRVGGGVAFY